MKRIEKSEKFPSAKTKKSQYLHSPDHVLADELSVKLRDKRHFGFYLKMALLYDHLFLRKLAGEVLESPSVRSPGKLFAFLLKKHREEGTAPRSIFK